MRTTISRTTNGNAVLENFNEYACGNYNEGNPQSNNNVQVGELVLDQENKLGVVLASIPMGILDVIQMVFAMIQKSPNYLMNWQLRCLINNVGEKLEHFKNKTL